MTDLETISVYDSNSHAYATMTISSKPSKHLETFMREVKNGGTVLDLGCGPGNAAAFMSSNGFKVVATDASAEMVKVAKIENNIDVLHQSFEDIKWVNNFDGVWAHFSLLHATKRRFSNHLTALHRSLKPKGVFTIGMKLGEGEKRDDIGRFYSYYSEPQLIELLKENEFKTQEISHGEDIGLDGKLSAWVIIRANA